MNKNLNEASFEEKIGQNGMTEDVEEEKWRMDGI